MTPVRLSALRGICQLPAYVADATGLFRQRGVDVRVEIEPTAWVIPGRLVRNEIQFAVMPWTRVAAANVAGEPLVLVSGSGRDEAAIVLRPGVAADAVRKVAVPKEGGIKDLTAVGLVQSLGWKDIEWVRLPSGDGAILSFVGQGAEAASMVEPYATMLRELGLGTVLRRTGHLWKGAPGCSLTTTAAVIDAQPDVVQAVVAAFADGAAFVHDHPAEAAAIAARVIGIDARFVLASLEHCRPDLNALYNQPAMDSILELMLGLGYLARRPSDSFRDLRFLERTGRARPAAD